MLTSLKLREQTTQTMTQALRSQALLNVNTHISLSGAWTRCFMFYNPMKEMMDVAEDAAS